MPYTHATSRTTGGHHRTLTNHREGHGHGARAMPGATTGGATGGQCVPAAPREHPVKISETRAASMHHGQDPTLPGLWSKPFPSVTAAHHPPPARSNSPPHRNHHLKRSLPSTQFFAVLLSSLPVCAPNVYGCSPVLYARGGAQPSKWHMARKVDRPQIPACARGCVAHMCAGR